MDDKEKAAADAEQKEEKTEAAEKQRIDVVVEVPCLGGGGKVKELRR